ncbi:MAG TPA: hypothetical protein VNN25_01085 [Thermoanaerobaculia bacterium]|nr:hypothetical protein [Thermoanaerobaculia bacterium]
MFAVTYVVPADRVEVERSNAIIVGRVLRSHVERSPQFGIETVTDVVLEETVKGSVESLFQIHEPGGVLDDQAYVIPGVPAFIVGDRVLLFLYQRENGEYTVNDFELGSFHFTKDAAGRELVIRNESEVNGWDLDGTPHKEPHRAAQQFINYIRGIVRGEEVGEDYVVATLPLAGVTETVKAEPGSLHPITTAAFTAASYTVDLSAGLGARWNIFPSTVSWNRGNSETGVLGNGASQIATAFASWNGGGAHYVLASANPNPNGIMDALDGINNIVFEKNLTGAGLQPYSCTKGGALGMGGMHSALFGGGTHVFHGETFGTTVEVDVSMNQGLGACTLAQLSSEQFNTTVTHEVGHTLGFRHSDQNRTQNALCTTDPSLDCSNAALMDHLLLVGLNGQLQPWDSSAISIVYGNGPACTPPSIAQQPGGSTITSGNSAFLSVTATGTPPLTYQWFAGSSGNTSTPVNGAGATISVGPAVTTSYWVRVTGQCAPAADSAAATITVNPANCPTVVLGTPQAIPVNGGFQLSINTSGGNSFTYLWFLGTSPGLGSQIGAGNPLLVNPAQTASYWCRVTNNCSNTADSAVVTVTIVPCSAPQIVNQPQNQTALIGTTASLTVGANGTAPTITWFQGPSGNTSTPVGSGKTITSPVLTQTTQFWARITNSCGSIDSNAGTITVEVARHRAARR